MDNERLLKKVMNAKVDGRSGRGRPRFGWMDGVKRALNDRRMDIREANEHARNRNETGSRSPCMRPRSDPPNFGPMERCEKQTNNID